MMSTHRWNRRLAMLGWLLWLASGGGACSATRVAITVDDLPVHGELPKDATRLRVAEQMLTAFDRHHVRGVYGFINGQRMEEQGDAILKLWVQRGQALGNHTFSHLHIDEKSVAEFEADILRNEPILGEYCSTMDCKWFRYPFISEGADPARRDAVRALLGKHGYRIAQDSLDFQDWAWQEPYARCMDRGDQASLTKLKETYLSEALGALRSARAAAKQLVGRSVKLILVLHVGAFSAAMLDELLTAYEKAGVVFVSLKEASDDPVYRIDPKIFVPRFFLDQLKMARGIPLPPRMDRAWLSEICRS